MNRAWIVTGMATMLAMCAGAEEGPDLFPAARDGKWGYVDRSGKVAIPLQYDCAWDFSEGLAAVQVGLLRGYIDPKGTMIIQPAYALAGPFHEGLAAAVVGAGRAGKLMAGGHWVYIDKTGKIAIEPKGQPLVSADEFFEGEARISFEIRGNPQYGHMTTNGVIRECALPPGRFCEGLAAWASPQKLYGYIDHSRKVVISNEYERAGDFCEGLAPVSKNKKWRYIDKTGNRAFEGDFDDARGFSEGMAGVQVGGKWGCIDKAGKLVVAPQFDFVAPFSEGLARIVRGNKHGYMDKTGKVVVEPRFDGGWEFSKGLARIVVGKSEGYIDKAGKYVWEPKEPPFTLTEK